MSKHQKSSARRFLDLLRLIAADLTINRRSSPDDGDEEYFGDLSLDKVVIVTRWLGRIRGAQALVPVPKSSARPCKSCGTPVVPVKFGCLKYYAEIERPWADEELIVNLIADHSCDGGDDNE